MLVGRIYVTRQRSGLRLVLLEMQREAPVYVAKQGINGLGERRKADT